MNNASNEYMTLDEFVNYLTEHIDVSHKNGKGSLKISYKRLLKSNYSNQEFKDIIKIKEPEVFVSKQKVIESVELYNNSIGVPLVMKALFGENTKRHSQCIQRKVNTYSIPLVNKATGYISKNDYNRILDSFEKIKVQKCITTNKLYEKIKSEIPELIQTFNRFSITVSNVFEGKYIPVSDLGNFENKNLFPQTVVKEVLKYYKENSEYLCGCKSKTKLINLTYKEHEKITEHELKRVFSIVTLDELNELVEHNYNVFGRINFVSLSKKLNNEKVKIIYKNDDLIYINKEWLKWRKFVIEHCVLVENITNATIRQHVHNRQEKFHFINKCYLERKYVDEITLEYNIRKELENAKTLYQCFEIKHRELENLNKNKYPKFNDIYFKFVKSKKIKSKNGSSMYFNLYQLFIKTLRKDFDVLSLNEISKLMEKVLYSIESGTDRKAFLEFSNYLNKVAKINVGYYRDDKEIGTKVEYDQENFIRLLFTLTNLVNDKHLRSKLYRDWELSSAVSYIFALFCLAWRQKDIEKRLAKPILNFIGTYVDGENLIEWLELGNEIDERTSIKICKGIEEETERLRIEANKTKAELMCVISEEMSNDLATLLCICEANRQIYMKTKYGKRTKHNNMFHTASIQPLSIQKLLKEKLDINVEGILGEKFDNIRMNKSYLNYIKEKAEELKVAYAYIVAQSARSHKVRKGDLVSEMTKVYLNREVTEDSLRAFAVGTMGSVLHVVNNIINNEYASLSNEKQVDIIQNMSITPLEIEKNIQCINKKVTTMEAEIINYFNNGGKKENLLYNVIFGEFFGVTDRTKCLIKITRTDTGGIKMVYSEHTKNCPLGKKSCFGCDYMIAMRFFIYVLEQKLSEVISKIEDCAADDFDLEIYRSQLKTLYLPLIEDLGEKLLGEEVGKVFDTVRYLEAVKKIDERKI